MDAIEVATIEGDQTQSDLKLWAQIHLGSLVHTPLHIAAFEGHASNVDQILEECPDLARVLNQRRWSPLRLAVLRGHIDIVKALLLKAPEMCGVIDDDGYNPLHLAAIMGWKEGLVELIKVQRHVDFEVTSNTDQVLYELRKHHRHVSFEAASNGKLLIKLIKDQQHVAFEVTSNGESILHLCVKHNNLDCLEWLFKTFPDYEFINAKDKAGNNILHQAVRSKKIEIINLIISLHKKDFKVDINATNALGLSPLDIISLQQNKTDTDRTIKKTLTDVGAERKVIYANSDWLTKRRDALMVVASLIATMAFAAGRNPPGGVWKDTQDGHQAGEAIFNYLGSFKWYLRFNTTAFISSLSIILLLISGLPLKNRKSMGLLQVIMWITITVLAFCYLYVIAWVSPKKDRASMERTMIWSIATWSFVMALIVLGNVIRLFMKWIKKMLII